MSQDAELGWGVLDFLPDAPTDEGWMVEAIAEGTTFGNPEAVIETVRSLLTDGSLAVLEGWDNREMVFRLRLSAPTALAGPALVKAETALMGELRAERKSPLRYLPPATDAAACYFDVVVAQLEQDHGNGADIEEVLREYRYYQLTLTCLPFARTEKSVVVPAIAVPPNPGSPPTVVDIDTCTSTASWSYPTAYSNMNGGSFTAIASSGGSINTAGSVAASGPPASYTVRRTGSVTFGSTPYLRVTATITGGTDPYLMYKTSTGLAIATAPSSLVVGATDYYFQPDASVTEILLFIAAKPGTVAGTTLAAQIHHLAKTDAIPGSGSTRQQSRLASVSGSAPTQAAIRLFDATPAALGTEILVHTSRNTAWQPPLRPYRITSATVTSDTAMVSGARNTLTSAMTFRIPANLLTEGTYSLMARLNVTTGGSLGWSAKVVSSAGAATVGSSVVVSGSQTVPITSGYQIVNLAALALPVVRAEADQMIELTLTGTANMTIDEGYLFGLHDGALTWLTDLDSLTWIEIRSPELGAARPSVYGGTGAKGTNSVCVDWKAKSFGAHRFEPGLMQIFTVTSTSLVSQSEIEFFPRGHSYVLAEWAA